MAHQKLKSGCKNRPRGALQLRSRQYSERPSGPLFLSARASTGSVTSESKSVTSPVTNTKKIDFGGFIGKEGVIFSTKLYRCHIDMSLSEMGYSELVQRLFENITFFLVDPLVMMATITTTATTRQQQ